MRIYWAAMPLSFLLGCFAHSLTHEANAAPLSEQCQKCESFFSQVCATREEVEVLHARVVVIEERIAIHREVIEMLRSQLGLRERREE